MPSFFNDGNTPARSDGMWKIEQKILGALNDLVAIGGGGVGSGAVFGGSADPEGVVTAPVNSIYNQTVAGTFIRQWVKVSGSGNTGWQ